MTGKYVAIIVHEDVLAEAFDRLADSIRTETRVGRNYDEDAWLRDLIDPLPEPDINNVTPRILRLTRDEADNLSENRWRIGSTDPDGWTYADRMEYDPPRR